MQELQSKIILAKNINIDKNYTNVIDYTTQQMIDLLSDNNHVVAILDDYSFIRANGTIFVDIPYDECLQSNYIAFQNKDYSNKWFFAWIDEVIFNSEKNSEIRFTVDHWSTWLGTWTQKPCFVKREHVNDDTIGVHTLDEDISTGELICDRTDLLQELTTGRWNWIVVASNYNPFTGQSGSGVTFVDGIINGCGLYAWMYDSTNFGSDSDPDTSDHILPVLKSINRWLHKVTLDGHPDDIVAMYIVPGNAINTSDIEQVEDPTNPGTYISTHRIIRTTLQGKSRDNESTKAVQRAFSDYSPKNNRLYCYPYSFIRITNNARKFQRLSH